MTFERKKHNTQELIEELFVGDTSFIEYDPNLKLKDAQYFRIEQSTHDGTLLFVKELMTKALGRLTDKNSVHLPTCPDNLKDIKYKVGPTYHSTVFGRVQLPCGKFPGQKDRIRIPVICEYIV